jgi:hypothetical protein
LPKSPKTTAAAHQWVSKLVNFMCKPASQKILDRQENLPEGAYETSDFLKSVELQRKPLALLGKLRHWLLADENDLHFDWLGMISACTKIWNTILPKLRVDPIFENHASALFWPDQTVARLLATASMAEQDGITLPLFEWVWESIQHAIHAPVARKPAEKSWGGDAPLVKLLKLSNPTRMLMNPGPVSFMRLYADWIDHDKRESRVGRAVWNAIHAVTARSNMKDNEQHSDVGVEGDEAPSSKDSDQETAGVNTEREKMVLTTKTLILTRKDTKAISGKALRL